MDSTLLKRLKPWIPVITFVVGTCLGSGSVWQWLHSRVESQQHALKVLQETTELRKAELNQYAEFVNLTDEYTKAKEEYKKTQSAASSIKVTQLETQVNLVVGNFTDTEAKLAQLEGRPPRKIRFVSPTIEAPSAFRAMQTH